MVEIISNRNLSIKSQVLIGISIVLILGLTQSMIPLWITLGVALGVLCGALVLRNGYWGLTLFIVLNALVTFKSEEENAFNVLYIIAGVCITIIFLFYLVRDRLLEGNELFSHWSQYFLSTYFLWTLVVGIGGIFFWNNKPENWYREFLLQAPLLFTPILMSRYISTNEKKLKALGWLILSIWAGFIVVNLVQYQTKIANAVYLYETGRSQIDIGIPSLLLFIFVALSSIETNKLRRRLYFGAVLFSLIPILISLYRTIWLTDILLLLILPFMFKGIERKRTFKFLISLTAMMAILVTFASLFFPFIGLLFLSYFNRFLYSSKITVDPSLVNRYIEWRIIWEYIRANIIAGYGYGAEYLDYIWITGTHIWFGYSHNSFLFLLFKSGIIGFIFLATAYIGILWKAWKLSKNTQLPDRDRALLVGCICYLIALLFYGQTVNTLGQRDQLLWASVCFGYILIVERKTRVLLSKNTFHKQ